MRDTSEGRSLFAEADTEVEAQSWLKLLNRDATLYENEMQQKMSPPLAEIESTEKGVVDAEALPHELVDQIVERRKNERRVLKAEDVEVEAVKVALTQAHRMEKIQAIRTAESTKQQKLRAEGLLTSVARDLMEEFIQHLQSGLRIKKFSAKV